MEYLILSRERERESTGDHKQVLQNGKNRSIHTRIRIVDKKGNNKNKDYASTLTGGGHSGGNHSDMDLIIEH
jgi:hypothetical protein